MTTNYRIRQYGSNLTLAFVRTVVRDGGLYVYVRLAGEVEWTEDFDAYALLMGDDGAVEQISDTEADALATTVAFSVTQ